ncbi:class I SAM-dependent methyltransferase [Krasilnikoviella flava]|uniref:class I SAM-dependent methyltransferase n=1 Tax=Krasilnikoviella flava TaxID=526729 RepID=UPI0009A8582D|nr:class I SAM-dependent methyltransferase [Krasilnikoviella flava]
MRPSANGGSASLDRSDYWWYRTRAHLLRTVLGAYADDAADVLDVGSADGPSVGWLQGQRHHVTLDIDPRGLASGSGVCGSATALPFEDSVFDVVGAFDVVEHCDPEAVVLAEVRRVLRPGGCFLLTVPAYQWLWSDFDVRNGHVRRYTRGRAVAALEGGGFEVLRATYAFASTFPAFVVERLARRARGLVRRDGGHAADIVRLPRTSPVVDRVLTALGTVDDRVLARRDLPFGSSVVVAARRPLS